MKKTMEDQAEIRSNIVNRHVNLLLNNEFDLVPTVVRMLAKGKPVAIKDLASKAGWAEGKISESLSRHPRVEYDDQGRIVGFGMTFRPTPHRFDFKGKTVYGWCASDALMFPILIREPGVVSSTCFVTGKKIRIKLEPDTVVDVDPPETVVSLVRPEGKVHDVRSECCDIGLFFSSHDAAKDWLAKYPEGFLHSVREDFEVNRQVLGELGWISE